MMAVGNRITRVSLALFWSAENTLQRRTFFDLQEKISTLTVNQEIIKVREQILHLGLKPKVIPLKLFFDMVPRSFIGFFNIVMQGPLVQKAAEWSSEK